MGAFMAKVFAGERTWLHRILRPVETAIYKICGIDEAAEQHWTRYAGSVLAFSAVSLLFTYLILRLQQWFPWNPAGLANVGEHLSWNTAVSFTSNTNWQSYSPETDHELSQRRWSRWPPTTSFRRRRESRSPSRWSADSRATPPERSATSGWISRARTLYILLPISIVAALLLCSQGVIQNLNPYTKVTTLEGTVQTIAQGPVASQEAIKMLGTNGGGFFNANSAHPYENPTPLANFLQMVLIFLIPAGLTYTFGKMVKDTRQGWALLAAMTVLFLAGVFVVYPAEQAGNPVLHAPRRGGRQHGRQRGPLRHRQLRALHRRHHRRKLRRRQQHARQPHADRRPCSAGQYRIGRSRLRRRRLGLVRHAAVRHPRGIHRRTDGGPHPGVSRQEDRAEGSQDGDARRHGAGVLHPRLLAPWVSARPPSRAA